MVQDTQGGQEHLSRIAISLVVGRLRALFSQRQSRDLKDERYSLIFLDGLYRLYLKVRLAKRVVSVPVLVVMGVAEEISKKLISLEIVVSESSLSWARFVKDLGDRGLRAPYLLTTGGHAELKKTHLNSPQVPVQRGVKHKRENLIRICPKPAHKKRKHDWHALVRANIADTSEKACHTMVAKWRKLSLLVQRSLGEGGLNLVTFYGFPLSTWKGSRSVNSIKNPDREFRRRTKAESSFSTEESSVTFIFSLATFRQIEFRRIAAYENIAELLNKPRTTDRAGYFIYKGVVWKSNSSFFTKRGTYPRLPSSRSA